eukprot:scaffold12822_cov112-Isochrysis_galbana.AAC.2
MWSSTSWCVGVLAGGSSVFSAVHQMFIMDRCAALHAHHPPSSRNPLEVCETESMGAVRARTCQGDRRVAVEFLFRMI